MMQKPMTFLALFIVGALTMFLFEAWYTLLLGMALQLAAVVVGVFVIAEPRFLTEDAGQPAAKPETE